MRSAQIIFSVLICLWVQFLTGQSRVVLIEQFTNSSCGPCAAASPAVFAYASSNPTQVAVVSYHTLFPYNNDSMYFENPVDVNARVSFYQVNSVPHTVMDGSVFSGSTNNFLSLHPANVNARLAVAPLYNIQKINLNFSAGAFNGMFQFTSLSDSNINDSLRAFVVIVEKNVQKSSYAASPGANTENEYGYVMRKIIYGAAGVKVVNKKLNGGFLIGWTDYKLTNIKNVHEVRFIAFVQNENTREILQAQMFELPIVAGIDESASDLEEVSVFPNPGNSALTITLNKPEWLHGIEIFDHSGRRVYLRKIEEMSSTITEYHGLPAGFYFLRLRSARKNYTHKFVVSP